MAVEEYEGEHPTILTVGSLGCVGLLLPLLVAVGGIYLPPSIHVGYGAVWTAVLLPFTLYRPSRRKLGLVLTFWLILLIAQYGPWNSRQVFLWDFGKIKVGMTVEEVNEIMTGYMTGTGWPAGPYPADPLPLTEVTSGTTVMTTASADGELILRDSLVFRHSDDGNYNSDWGVVRIQNGRVTHKQFMPD